MGIASHKGPGNNPEKWTPEKANAGSAKRSKLEESRGALYANCKNPSETLHREGTSKNSTEAEGAMRLEERSYSRETNMSSSERTGRRSNTSYLSPFGDSLRSSFRVHIEGGSTGEFDHIC